MSERKINPEDAPTADLEDVWKVPSRDGFREPTSARLQHLEHMKKFAARNAEVSVNWPEPPEGFEIKNTSYNLTRPDLWPVDQQNKFEQLVRSLLSNGVAYVLSPDIPPGVRAHYEAIINSIEQELGLTVEELILREAHRSHNL